MIYSKKQKLLEMSEVIDSFSQKYKWIQLKWILWFDFVVFFIM